MVAKVGPVIEALSRLSAQPSWLFRLTFHDLRIRGVLFVRARTILVGIESLNVAWQVAIQDDGLVAGWIPEEAFQHVARFLRDSAGKVTTAPLFAALEDAVTELAAAGTGSAASNDEILRLRGLCRTRDQRYEDGAHPYFDHWRRVPPSDSNLHKIQDHFGVRVRKACKEHGVTAVWWAQPRQGALLFLDPREALAEMNDLRARPRPERDRQAAASP
jgi:hypothetical protein